MRRYILKRLIYLIPIVLGITFLSFALMQLASGDVVDKLYENTSTVVSENIMAQRRAELGLDKPFIIQYFNWLIRFIQGDMGTSFVTGKEVFKTFISKLPSTIFLALFSLFIAVVISIPLGIISALKQNSFWDYLVRFLSFIGNSMPGFFVALLLMYLFSVRLQALPIMGGMSLKGIILPAITLSIAMSAKYIRQVRAAVLGELKKGYVAGAKARGIKVHTILLKNVLKTSMVSLITFFSLSLGSLLGGTAIIETIFMWDGVGKLAVDAINMRDYPVIQAYVVWMALIYLLINLASDILYYYADPRIHLGLEERHNV